MFKEAPTNRLILRTPTENDITESYIQGLNEKEIIKYTESRHQSWNRQQVAEYINSQSEFKSEMIGLFKKEDNKYFGNIRLAFTPVHERVELGILLFDKSEWGKGYALEALLGIEEYVFNCLNYVKICAEYYAVNLASAAIFKKAGYVEQGRFLAHFKLDDLWIDAVRIAKFSPRFDLRKIS